MNTCQHCRTEFRFKRSDARYCSTRCRVAAHRADNGHQIPAELLSRPNWVRWMVKRRNGVPSKMPIKLDGTAASSINPATWTDFEAVQASSRGAGMGYMLDGDGTACLDLDHCLTDGVPSEAAQRVLDRFPTAWVEVSPSGDGLHVWGTAKAQPGRNTVIDGLHIEFYTRTRYLTVTGNTYRAGGLTEQLSLKVL